MIPNVKLYPKPTPGLVWCLVVTPTHETDSVSKPFFLFLPTYHPFHDCLTLCWWFDLDTRSSTCRVVCWSRSVTGHLLLGTVPKYHECPLLLSDSALLWERGTTRVLRGVWVKVQTEDPTFGP